MNQEPRVYRVGDIVKSNSTEYTIANREGNLAYAVYREHHGSKRWNLELWLIRGLLSDKKLPDGSVQPKGTEYLPSASLWGTYAVSLAPWWDAKPEIVTWEEAKALMHPGYPKKIKRFCMARFDNPAFPPQVETANAVS